MEFCDIILEEFKAYKQCFETKKNSVQMSMLG